MECVGRVLNPRRADFDVTQEQSINNEYFSDQVNWELDEIEQAHIAFMNFDPATKSPITLAELGYLIGLQHSHISSDVKQEIIVCCPDGFWRKGNVEIMVDRADGMYGRDSRFVTATRTVHLFHTYEEAEKYLISRVWSKHRLLSTAYGFFPYQGPSESQRELKLYAGRRGLKIPKDFRSDDPIA
jgi:hypothetical protein